MVLLRRIWLGGDPVGAEVDCWCQGVGVWLATATFGEENTYPIQRWFLWREDGVWLISVAGFANTSVIPAELIGAWILFLSFVRRVRLLRRIR